MKKLSLFTVMLFILVHAFPQAGTLDVTFNEDGIALYDPGDLHDNGRGIVCLDDKSMIVAGVAQIDGEFACVLMKLNEDSSIDLNWGTDGIVEFQIGENGTHPFQMIQLDGGELLVGGLVYEVGYDGEFFLAKFDLDGTLDTDFNGTGYTISDYSNDDEVCETMAIQPDGKIVCAGRTYSGNFSQLLFARFNADGSLDEDFGNNGYTEIDASPQDEKVQSLGILSNGTIVGFGDGYQSDPFWGHLAFMAKLNADGVPMSGFGSNGVMTPAIFDDNSRAWDIYIKNDSILVTGDIYNASNENEFYLAKLDSSGIADANFATDGIHKLNINPSNIGLDIMVTEDDKIYVSGTSGLGGPNNSSMLLARFLPDGSLDQSFSGAGYVLTDIRSDWDEAFAMDIQVDGKIVLTGNSGGLTNSGDNKIPVTRYLNDYAPFSAAFTSDDTTVCVNESVQFTDESFGNVVAWEWTFEGGSPSTSTEQNPEITYNTLGIYDVQLIVTSDEAETDTIIKEDYVTVIDIPTDIDTPAGETTLCNGSIYEYSTNPVLYAEYYNWEVSPENAGIINANDTSATFAPDEDYTGTFAIKVQAGNDCGVGEWSDELSGTVYEAPAIFSMTGGGTYCSGDDGIEVGLDGSETGVEYELFLDDVSTGIVIEGTGSTISFGMQTDFGFYSALGYNENCTENMNDQAEVDVLFPPDTPGTPVGPEVICTEPSSDYSSEGTFGADSYEWMLIPEDAGTITATDLNATVVWNAEFNGLAAISLYGINECGEGNPSEALEVSVGAPNPQIAGEEMVCDWSDEIYEVPENIGSTYTWEVTGGSISEGQGTFIITVAWQGEGNGTVQVNEETADGCEGSSETFEVVIDDCTGINETNNDEVVILPNPADHHLTIRSTDIIEAVYLFSIKGREVKNVTEPGSKIFMDVSDLKPGIYLLRLNFGNQVIIKKVIIE